MNSSWALGIGALGVATAATQSGEGGLFGGSKPKQSGTEGSSLVKNRSCLGTKHPRQERVLFKFKPSDCTVRARVADQHSPGGLSTILARDQ